MRTFRKALRDECGATAVEYALLACFISVCLITGGTALGNRLNGSFDGITTSLSVAAESLATNGEAGGGGRGGGKDETPGGDGGVEVAASEPSGGSIDDAAIKESDAKDDSAIKGSDAKDDAAVKEPHAKDDAADKAATKAAAGAGSGRS